MFYRDALQRRFRVSSLTLADWVALSFVVATAAAIAFMLFHVAAWAIGWPGPLVWFGGDSRLADIGIGGAAIAVSIFCFNLLGASALRIYFWLLKLIRRR